MLRNHLPTATNCKISAHAHENNFQILGGDVSLPESIQPITTSLPQLKNSSPSGSGNDGNVCEQNFLHPRVLLCIKV